MDEVIEKLKDLGLNSYESKVYVALLKKFPATGYEAAKLADIPQARAYDTLKALENANIVVSTSSKPVTYTPIRPSELTKRFKRKTLATIDFLDKNLPQVKDHYTEPILTVSGRNAISEKVIEIIENARKEIYLEVWAQDFRMFEPYLLKAYERGVDVKMVGYDNIQCSFGTFFEHAFAKEIELSLGGRMIIMAIDNLEGIVGKSASLKGETTNVIWTKNEGIVFLIKEFIVHDMYLLDVEENLSQQMKTVYGAGLKSLRDKILGENYLYRIH